MDGSDTGTGKSRDCIKINDKSWCYDPAPADPSRCLNIEKRFFCQPERRDKTFKEEVGRFKKILFYPKLRIDESKQLEGLLIELTIGFIITALTWVLSGYISDAINYFIDTYIPGGETIAIIIAIIMSIIIIMIVLSFFQYRLIKAAEHTNMLEKFAEKDAQGIVKTAMEEPFEVSESIARKLSS